MPLFEVVDGQLVHIRTVRPGADLYEREIEQLLWDNLESFTGEALFPVARQPRIGGGGIPDVVAMDDSGRVVVIEVKRDVDRGQLAQCLEYAGWARGTNLDELAGIYHRGAAAFFDDWRDFTDSSSLKVVNASPRLILVAGEFQGRTRAALDFLQENGLPVTVIPVAVYEDGTGRRFTDVDADHEPVAPPGPDPEAQPHLYRGRRMQIADLLEAKLLESGDDLVWARPRRGETYRAVLLDTGDIQLEDGRVASSPSKAAMLAADIPAYDGWYAWRVARLGDKTLNDLRRQLIDSERSGG